MFSVVIPLFNKAPYIEQCLTSVLGQTLANLEVLVVNDVSTDDGPARVRKFTDARLTLIDQPNAGVSAARNRGAQEARYDYIVFLDADDWLHPHFLSSLRSLVVQCPDADLYGTNYYYVKHGRQRVEPKGLPETFSAGYIDYISLYGSRFCVLINCSFVAVRRTAFWRAGGFRPRLRFGEDFDLWIRLALAGKVAYCNQPLAYSNQDAAPANRAIGGHRLYAPEAHFIFNLAYLRPYERQSPNLKWLLDGLRVRNGLPYYLSGRYPDAVRSLLAEVDFSRQPRYFRLLYQTPVPLARIYFGARRLGAGLKRTLVAFKL